MERRSSDRGVHAAKSSAPRSSDTRVRKDDKSAPRLPNERDESADSQADRAAADDPVQRQAHEDVKRGLVDTDKGPVIEQTYEKVRSSDGGGVRR